MTGHEIRDESTAAKLGRAMARPAQMYLQTERLHHLGHGQALVCPDAVLVEALRGIGASLWSSSATVISKSTLAAGSTPAGPIAQHNRQVGRKQASTGICILRS